MKLLAPLVLALTVVSAQPFQDGLAGRPAKRGAQQIAKNDVIADKQAWKRTGDWHGDWHGDHEEKCSDFLCRLECKKQGFCRSECRKGQCKCSVRRDQNGKCSSPSKTPHPGHPKPTHGHGRGGAEDDGEGDDTE